MYVDAPTTHNKEVKIKNDDTSYTHFNHNGSNNYIRGSHLYVDAPTTHSEELIIRNITTPTRIIATYEVQI